jgi:hypothetical protein
MTDQDTLDRLTGGVTLDEAFTLDGVSAEQVLIAGAMCFSDEAPMPPEAADSTIRALVLALAAALADAKKLAARLEWLEMRAGRFIHQNPKGETS